MELDFDSSIIYLMLFIILILFYLVAARVYKKGFNSGMIECLRNFENRNNFFFETIENEIKSCQRMIDGNTEFWESEIIKHQNSIQFYDEEIANAHNEAEKNKLIEMKNSIIKSDEEFFAKREDEHNRYSVEKESLERHFKELLVINPELYEREKLLKYEYFNFFKCGLEKAFAGGDLAVEIYQDYMKKIRDNEEKNNE